LGGVHALLLGCSLVFLFRVVPVYEAMFADMGSTLPALTQLVLQLSQLVRSAWFVSLPLLALGLAANTAALTLLTRWRSAALGVVLGLLECGVLLVLPIAIVGALYLPIFAMAGAIE
jgi:type II secretory pathway component PulF